MHRAGHPCASSSQPQHPAAPPNTHPRLIHAPHPSYEELVSRLTEELNRFQKERAADTNALLRDLALTQARGGGVRGVLCGTRRPRFHTLHRAQPLLLAAAPSQSPRHPCARTVHAGVPGGGRRQGLERAPERAASDTGRARRGGLTCMRPLAGSGAPAWPRALRCTHVHACGPRHPLQCALHLAAACMALLHGPVRLESACEGGAACACDAQRPHVGLCCEAFGAECGLERSQTGGCAGQRAADAAQVGAWLCMQGRAYARACAASCMGAPLSNQHARAAAGKAAALARVGGPWRRGVGVKAGLLLIREDSS